MNNYTEIANELNKHLVGVNPKVQDKIRSIFLKTIAGLHADASAVKTMITDLENLRTLTISLEAVINGNGSYVPLPNMQKQRESILLDNEAFLLTCAWVVDLIDNCPSVICEIDYDTYIEISENLEDSISFCKTKKQNKELIFLVAFQVAWATVQDVAKTKKAKKNEDDCFVFEITKTIREAFSKLSYLI